MRILLTTLLILVSFSAFSDAVTHMSKKTYMEIRARGQKIRIGDMVYADISKYRGEGLSYSQIFKKINAVNSHFRVNNNILLSKNADGHILSISKDQTSGCGISHDLDKNVELKYNEKLQIIDYSGECWYLGGRSCDDTYTTLRSNGDIVYVRCVEGEDSVYNYVADIAKGLGNDLIFLIAVERP